MRAIDRRSFLALGLGAAAWSCARDNRPAASPPTGDISVVVTAQVGLAAGDSRNAIAIFRGQKPFAPKNLRARLVPPKGEPVEVMLRREKIGFGQGGDKPDTEVADIYVFRHDFDPGVWQVQAIADNKPGAAVFQVAATTPSPKIGSRALPSQSPTTGNARGVNPICTRTPACSMHEMTIAEALAAKKPLVLNFGTPRFCTSRTCGPVVDIVEEQKKRVGDKANFIHVEVFRNTEVALKPTGTSPTYAEWKLAVEPWTYFIGADGIVKDRWMGAMGSDELARAVDTLIG